jgi:hypothetical protein
MYHAHHRPPLRVGRWFMNYGLVPMEQVGKLVGMTRQRARHYEQMAFRKIARVALDNPREFPRLAEMLRGTKYDEEKR